MGALYTADTLDKFYMQQVDLGVVERSHLDDFTKEMARKAKDGTLDPVDLNAIAANVAFHGHGRVPDKLVGLMHPDHIAAYNQSAQLCNGTTIALPAGAQVAAEKPEAGSKNIIQESVENAEGYVSTRNAVMASL